MCMRDVTVIYEMRSEEEKNGGKRNFLSGVRLV